MSTKELAKIKVLTSLIAKQITNQQAAERLGLCVRQVQRLKQAYLIEGDTAVIHKSRGKASSRGYGIAFKTKIIHLYQDEYAGWNFSHFNDMLEDEHQIKISDHYVHTILTEAGIKSPRAKKRQPRKHPPRDRRENAGELLQTDASMHLWIALEDRKYALHGMIDDATNIVTALALCDEETNLGYQIALADTIRRYGIPACLYTDYRTVFQSNKKLTPEEELEGKELEATRFAKMCQHLGVNIISTRIAQAKGRIERLWETLQDRLTKELKKADITKEEANKYINDVFLPRYNARFASPIDYSKNYFVKVPEDFDYNQELALPIIRTALHGCYVKLNNQTYQILKSDGSIANFRNSTKIVVYTCLDGSCYAKDQLQAVYKLKPITIAKVTKPIQSKRTSAELSKIRSECAKKNLNSPWRKYYAHH